MNRNYEKGVRLERHVQQLFEDAGWYAMRTAGSHSGVDVVAYSIAQANPLYDATVVGRRDAGWVTVKGNGRGQGEFFVRYISTKQTPQYNYTVRWGQVNGDAFSIFMGQCKVKQR